MTASRWCACVLLATLAGALGTTGCGSSGDTGKGGGGASATGCTTQMYKKYGDTAFTKVTTDLVMKAASDPKIGHYFSALDSKAKVDSFVQSLDAFLVMVYGGPNNYTGPDMPSAHAGLKISSDDYDYFVGLIVDVLQADGVSKDDIDNCFAPPVTASSFKDSIVGK